MDITFSVSLSTAYSRLLTGEYLTDVTFSETDCLHILCLTRHWICFADRRISYGYLSTAYSSLLTGEYLTDVTFSETDCLHILCLTRHCIFLGCWQDNISHRRHVLKY